MKPRAQGLLNGRPDWAFFPSVQLWSLTLDYLRPEVLHCGFQTMNTAFSNQITLASQSTLKREVGPGATP